MDTVVTKEGEELSASIYEPYDEDIFYMVLGGGVEVKSFDPTTSASDALAMFKERNYKGCPADRENYLHCIRFDLGVSHTLAFWDS